MKVALLMLAASACSFKAAGGPDATPDAPVVRHDAPVDGIVAKTCGDGVLNAGEECDDHNLVDGDGCDAMCQIEPAWLCPSGNPCIQVVGIAFDPSSGADLASVGSSTGGNSFSTACPSGEALIGFDGTDCDDRTCVGQIRAECAAISFSADGDIQWSTYDETGYRGSENNGDLGRTQCNTDELVVGFVGYAGIYLDGMQLLCQQVSFLHGGFVLAPVRTADPWAHTGNGASPATQCASGAAVTTFDGNSGATLDHFDMRCYTMASLSAH